MGQTGLKACIVAGGTSGRFGSDKSLHLYEGKPLVMHVLDAISPVFDDILISAREGEKFSFTGLEIIQDIIPGLGPIGGIYSAIEKIDAERIFLFPCDMPFISTEFVRYMTELPDYYDIVVPKTGGYYQPLHAIYSKKCAPRIRENIDREDYRMSGFYEGLEVRDVEDIEIEFYGDPFRIFKNVNFKEDLV